MSYFRPNNEGDGTDAGVDAEDLDDLYSYEDYSNGFDVHDGNLLDRLKHLQGWQLGVVAVIGIFVVIALISVVFGGGSNKANNKKTQTPPPTVIASDGSATSVATPTTASGTTVKAAGFSKKNVTATINSGLTAWTTYVTSGKSDQLSTYFVEGGAQYNSLIGNQTRVPLSFTDRKISVNSPKGDTTTADVSFVAVVDKKDQAKYELVFTLKLGSDGKWRIDSVANA